MSTDENWGPTPAETVGAETRRREMQSAAEAEAVRACGKPIPAGYTFASQVLEFIPRRLRRNGVMGRVIGWKATRETPAGRHVLDSWGAETFHPASPTPTESAVSRSRDAGEPGNEDAAWGSSSHDGWRVD